MSYPPQAAPYTPQPEPKKKSKAVGCLGIGCGGLALLAIIGGIAAAISGSGNHNTSTTVAAGPAATSSAPAAAAPKKTAPKAPAKPRLLLKISGNGMKNTAKFTTGDNWTIHYTYNCANFGSSGNFQVYVDYPNGDIPVNEIGNKGTDTSTATGAGTHTLKVASECKWTLTVTDG